MARETILPAVVLASLGLVARDVGGLAERPVGVLPLMLGTGLAALIAATARSRPFRFALGVGAVLLASGLAEGVNGRVLLRERDFFGVLTVTRDDRSHSHRLFHGSTLHGQQSLDPDRRREPLTYFTRGGPFGQIATVFAGRRPADAVAVVGLGIGSMAAYAGADQSWTFHEIDPAVIRIAEDPRFFTFLKDAREAGARIETAEGDARLRLRESPDGSLGLIVLDAFSSDAPPVHLLSREAFRLYRRKLAPGGLIAVNLSNRFLDLDPVIGALAADAGLSCRVRYDLDVPPEAKRAGTQPSIWAVLAARDDDLGILPEDGRWLRPRRRPGDRPWTDDRADLIRAFLVRPRSGPTAGRPPL